MIIKNFGLEIYGQINILTATLSSVVLITSFPTTPISIKLLTNFFEKKNFESFRGVLIVELIFQTFISIFFFLIIIILSPLIAKYLFKQESYTNIIVLFSLIKVISSFKGFINSYLNVFQKFKFLFSFNSLETFFKISGIFLLVKFTSNRYLSDIVFIYLATSILILFCFGILFYFHFNKTISFGRVSFDKIKVKDYFKLSSFLFAATTFKGIHSKLPEIVLSYFSGAQAVGLFAIYTKLASPTTYLTSSFSTINLPRIIIFKNQKKFNQINKIFNQYNQEILFVNIVTGTLIILFQNYLISFFGIKDLKISLLFLLFIYNYIYNLNWWNKIFGEVFNPKLLIILHLVILVISLIILPVLVFYKGFEGVFISMLITNLFAFLFLKYHLKKTLG